MSDENKKAESEGKEQTQELTDKQLEEAAGGTGDSFFDITYQIDFDSSENRGAEGLATPDPDESETKERG